MTRKRKEESRLIEHISAFNLCTLVIDTHNRIQVKVSTDRFLHLGHKGVVDGANYETSVTCKVGDREIIIEDKSVRYGVYDKALSGHSRVVRDVLKNFEQYTIPAFERRKLALEHS